MANAITARVTANYEAAEHAVSRHESAAWSTQQGIIKEGEGRGWSEGKIKDGVAYIWCVRRGDLKWYVCV